MFDKYIYVKCPKCGHKMELIFGCFSDISFPFVCKICSTNYSWSYDTVEEKIFNGELIEEIS